MKKVLVSISLMVSALTCWAEVPPIDPNWTVATQLDNGTHQLYEVLPDTADAKLIQQEVVSTALVRMRNAESGVIALRRLLVIGCDEGGGKVTIVAVDGTRIPDVPIFDWAKDGERVYDAMATFTCVAVLMGQKQPVEPATVPEPVKHQRIPQGTTV